MTVSKKLLNTIEWIASLVAAIGLAAKWSLVAEGNILLIVGLTALSSVCFLRAYSPADATARDQAPAEAIGPIHAPSVPAKTPSFLMDILLPKYINIGSAVVFIGVLFKLMSWNGSAMMLIGVVTMALVVVIMALGRRMHARALVVAALSGLVFYVSPETLVQQFHRDDPALVKKMIYQLNHPRDRAAAEDTRQYLQQKSARH